MGQLLDVAYNIEYGNVSTVQSSLNLIYLLGFQPALLHELPGIHGGRRRRRRARGERDPERLQGGNLSLGPVVVREVAPDHREIELFEDRFFRFAPEQEAKAVGYQFLGRTAPAPPFEVLH
jgi:hypothetical protein